MKKPNIVYNGLLWALCMSIFYTMCTLHAAAPLALERSLQPLYKDVELSLSHTCIQRKCHENHTYCPICVQKCKECPADCVNCQSSCSICLESFKGNEVREVVLQCKHSFCAKCIRLWQDTIRKFRKESEAHAQVAETCPMCRAPIDFKECALCHTSVYEWEPSCSYNCIHQDSGWECEEHIFHRRCIEPLALKSAFIAEKDIRNVIYMGVVMRVLKGDVAFHCPAKHKKCTSTIIDLKIPLSKVVNVAYYMNKAFPYKKKSCETSKCDVCHQEILHDQEKSSYSCTYRYSNWWLPFWQTQKHVCHTGCLKPLAERSSYIQKRNGVETGKLVFHCPLDHDHDVEYSLPSFNTDLEVEMLPGFTSDKVHRICPCCKEDVDTRNKEQLTVATFKGRPGVLYLEMDETIYFHDKCFGKFVAKTADLKPVGSSSSIKQRVYPCPCHEGTEWAHDIEFPEVEAIDVKSAQ